MLWRKQEREMAGGIFKWQSVRFTEVTFEQTLEGNESVIQTIGRKGAFQAKEQSVDGPSGTNMPDVFKK